MNPQFYESVGELVLDLVVNSQFSESEILKKETRVSTHVVDLLFSDKFGQTKIKDLDTSSEI